VHLFGKRIKLLPLNESDQDLFVEISMCPQMMEHVSDPCTYEEAKEMFYAKVQPWTIESDGWLTFGVADISTEEKLGSIGLKIVNHEVKIAEIGFMIKKSAQRKGYAIEAVSLLKTYAFSNLNLMKLVVLCSVNNAGSFNLLEKSGFIREGCLRRNSIINSKYIDDYTYGLCKTDL
jgi:ribosomal-protein-alanine N-acetyltransferase